MDMNQLFYHHQMAVIAADRAHRAGEAPAGPIGLASLGGRRAELFAAAVAVFAERGYRATSMRELAQAVGLSKSALYHYVRSKEELLVALYEDVLAQRLEEQSAVRSSGLPADEALRRILVDRFVHACANRQLLRAAMNAAGFVGINSEWWHFDCGDRVHVRATYHRVL